MPLEHEPCWTCWLSSGSLPAKLEFQHKTVVGGPDYNLHFEFELHHHGYLLLVAQHSLLPAYYLCIHLMYQVVTVLYWEAETRVLSTANQPQCTAVGRRCFDFIKTADLDLELTWRQCRLTRRSQARIVVGILSTTVYSIQFIEQGDFFNWYPPKKFKYVKPRLGASTLT